MICCTFLDIQLSIFSGPYHRPFQSTQAMATFFCFVLSYLSLCLSIFRYICSPLIRSLHPFCSSRNITFIQTSNRIFSYPCGEEFPHYSKDVLNLQLFGLDRGDSFLETFLDQGNRLCHQFRHAIGCDNLSWTNVIFQRMCVCYRGLFFFNSLLLSSVFPRLCYREASTPSSPYQMAWFIALHSLRLRTSTVD